MLNNVGLIAGDYLDEISAACIKAELENHVDVIITSPPYKKKDGYSDRLMQACGEVAGAALKPGGRVFFNFGQLRGAYARPHEAAEIFRQAAGLEWGQTICWVKSLVVDGAQRGHYTPINPKSPTLNYGWEPIFTFYKPPESALDRLSIGVPFADKSNLKRGSRGSNGDLHCAGDVWFVPYKTTGSTNKKAHEYEWPLEIPTRCIKLCGPDTQVVLDLFAGSGTTLKAAFNLGKTSIGVDLRYKNEEYAAKVLEAIKMGSSITLEK